MILESNCAMGEYVYSKDDVFLDDFTSLAVRHLMSYIRLLMQTDLL